MLPSYDVVQEMPVFGAWVSLCCLEPILLLEQGVGNDELMLRTELQTQTRGYEGRGRRPPLLQFQPAE